MRATLGTKTFLVLFATKVGGLETRWIQTMCLLKEIESPVHIGEIAPKELAWSKFVQVGENFGPDGKKRGKDSPGVVFAGLQVGEEEFLLEEVLKSFFLANSLVVFVERAGLHHCALGESGN